LSLIRPAAAKEIFGVAGGVADDDVGGAGAVASVVGVAGEEGEAVFAG
jgi:hypothetical protein